MNWLSKIKPWQFFLAAVLLAEAAVCLMSLLLKGEIAPDYLMTGLVVSSLVAPVMIFLVNLSNRLRLEKEALEVGIAERLKAQLDLDRIYELSDDLICTSTMTHFLRVNPAAERILGYSQEELLDIPFLDLIHPDDVEPTARAIEEKLKRGEPAIGFMNRYRNRDGTYRWLEWMTHPVTEEGLLYAVARDITDRKRLEDELMLLKKSVEMISTGITISDLEGRITYINPAGAGMHGYTVDELIGMEVNVFMPDGKKDSSRCRKTMADVKGWKEWSRVIDEVRKDGTVFPVQLKTIPVEDLDKRSLHIITTSEDISERRKVEKRLQLQAHMIDLLKDSLISTDMDGFVKTWNKGAERLFGYTAFEAIGRHILFVYPPEEHGNLQETIRRLKEEGQYETEVKMQRRNGEPIYAILSLSMIYNDAGSATGMLGYSIDVTQRKAMEENLRRALEDKDVLMKEIYHRTKNNMAVIQSLLNLQSGQIKDRDALNSFSESAHRIRTMSMIHERLYSTGNLSSINIREYLQSLSTGLFHSYGAEPSRIKLNMDVLDVKMDVDQVIPVGLIVNELLTNVFKYAFPDDRSGEVLVELKDNDEDTFMLTVSDSGVGLPVDFDIISARTLGLQLVSSLSAQLRGRLHFSADNGSAFSIIFKKDTGSF